MFKFLKDKLKQAVSKFTDEIDEKGDVVEEPSEEKLYPEDTELKDALDSVKTVEEKVEPVVEDVKEEPLTEVEEEKADVLVHTESGAWVSKNDYDEQVAKDKKAAEELSLHEAEHKEEKGFFEKIKDKIVGEDKEDKPEPVKEEPVKEAEPVVEESKPEPVKEEKPAVEEKEPVEEPNVEPEPVKGEPKEEVKPEAAREEPVVEEPKVELKSEPKVEKPVEKEEEPSGFFGKITKAITTKKINEKQFDELFWELEMGLLEGNVAVEVIEKIKDDLKKDLVDVALKRSQISDTILNSLKTSVSSLFDVPSVDILANIKQKKPYVVCFVGVNGSGKTTTIAKFVKMLQDNGLSVVLAASDTFRAAAIDQLQEHADNLNVKLIKHEYGSDPAAVAFDAVKYGESKKMDVVLIDTAGRLHSNINLMDELSKVIRVSKPDLKLFIGESITGNDCVEQAKKFHEAVGIDGVILSKADIDDKGGAAVSVSFITGKPILYFGTGQEYIDLEKFDSEKLMGSLGL